jgi:hypothetical protein
MKTFNELTNDAVTGKKSIIRALQAWQYLIAKAANRQTLRYEELSTLMGYKDDRPLSSILDPISNYCRQHDLPLLTAIVVNKFGAPGSGFPAYAFMSHTALDALQQRTWLDLERERVYDTAWFKIYPPSIAELELAQAQKKEAHA